MKAFVILSLVLAVQAFTEEQKKRLQQYSGECVDVSKVDPSVLKEAEKGVAVDDPKLKVHALCFSKKIQLQNEKGDLVEEKVRERLFKQMKNKDEVDKLMKMCLVQKGTPEDTAFDTLACFNKNSPKDVVVF